MLHNKLTNLYRVKHLHLGIGCYTGSNKKCRYEPVQPKLSNKPSNTPHPKKDPPEDGYNPETVDHIAFKIPYYIRPAVFRQFCNPEETLGPDASKSKDYKTPEYFGYHRYSFVELQNHSLRFSNERRTGTGLQVIYECDEEDEDDENDDEDFSPASVCSNNEEKKSDDKK